MSAHPCDRHQLSITHDRPDRGEDAFRHRLGGPAQGEAQLGAGVPGLGKLQVPSGVVPPGSPPQRHPVASQVQTRGVEVDRLQLQISRLADRTDTLNVVQGRKDRLRTDVELALGLLVML